MPGLSVPWDYSREPLRYPCSRINAKFFYKRNHGPIPMAEDIERYYVSITGLIQAPKQLFMKDIRNLPKYNVAVTLQCAGNRRTAMSESETIDDVGWDIAAIGNGGKGGPYKASIPLSQATDPQNDVLLAYEMNGEPLERDHGYPLRAIVPGVIGARSVKWLDSINIISEESQGFYMQKYYKMFPPYVNWDNVDWYTRTPQMDFPVQCAICSLEDVSIVKDGKITVKGYAVSGGGRGIERVDVSADRGKTWGEASRFQKGGIPYTAHDTSRNKWAWVFFQAIVQAPSSTEIVAKAVDTAASIQPEEAKSIWTLRGILNNSWHRVHVRVLHSNI